MALGGRGLKMNRGYKPICLKLANPAVLAHTSDKGYLDHVACGDDDALNGEEFLKFMEKFPTSTRSVIIGSGTDAKTVEIITAQMNINSTGIYSTLIQNMIDKFYSEKMLSALAEQYGAENVPRHTWNVLFKVFPTFSDMERAGIPVAVLSDIHTGIALSAYILINCANKSIFMCDSATLAPNGLKAPCILNNQIICAPVSVRRKCAVCCVTKMDRLSTGNSNARMGVIELMLDSPEEMTPKNILGNVPRSKIMGEDPKIVRCYLRDNVKSVNERNQRKDRSDKIVVRSNDGEGLVRKTKTKTQTTVDIEWDIPTEKPSFNTVVPVTEFDVDLLPNYNDVVSSVKTTMKMQNSVDPDTEPVFSTTEDTITHAYEKVIPPVAMEDPLFDDA